MINFILAISAHQIQCPFPLSLYNVNPASQILFAIDCQLSSTQNRLHGRVYKIRTALPAFADLFSPVPA